MTRFYGFDGELEPRLLSFEKALTANWIPFEYRLNRVINGKSEDYVDNIRYPPSYRARGRDLLLQLANGNQMSISDLDRFQTAWSRLPPLHEERNLQDTKEVVSKIKRDHPNILAVSISGNYFKN